VSGTAITKKIHKSLDDFRCPPAESESTVKKFIPRSACELEVRTFISIKEEIETGWATHCNKCSRQKGQGDKSDGLHCCTISFCRHRYLGAEVGHFLVDLAVTLRYHIGELVLTPKLAVAGKFALPKDVIELTSVCSLVNLFSFDTDLA
jgi:hypothetical protein